MHKGEALSYMQIRDLWAVRDARYRSRSALSEAEASAIRVYRRDEVRDVRMDDRASAFRDLIRWQAPVPMAW